MRIHEAFRHARDTLSAAGVDSPDADAWWLLEAVTGLDRARLVIERSRAVDPDEWTRLSAWLNRRARREPLQHIVGRTEFYGRVFDVDRRALIPRPETERLVELALERLREIADPRVLDVGTGSGAIAVTIAAERPDAVIMATDASAEALSLAAQNARRHGVAPSFALSELLAESEVDTFARSADMIVTNLPYLPDADRDAVSPEVRHDPELALYGGARGAELFEELLVQAARSLPSRAWLVAELDPRNVHQAGAKAARDEWRVVEVARDLAGRDRFLVLRR